MIKIGDKYKVRNYQLVWEDYILVAVNSEEICFVSLSTGNRWGDAEAVIREENGYIPETYIKEQFSNVLYKKL